VVHYLAGQGRQRIALINHDLRYRYARLRQKGYAHQLKEQQLAWQAIAYASELSFSAGKAAMNQLLAGETRPDAVFAVSDTLAAGAMAAIQQAGLRIPQDIAVVGFDGSELADMVSPPLTTLAQPSREIGRRACELVLQKIIRPDSPPQCVIMQGELVVRASS
jgi:DNA-binding LacI/PurR family transcriptional regulator